MKAVRVNLMKRAGRPYYEAQWRDPVTGRLRTESTGADRRRDAERIAGQIERDVNAGTYRKQRLATWVEAVDRYESELIAARSARTAEKWRATRRAVERHISPRLLTAIDAAAVSKLAAALREGGREEATIKSHLVHLKAFLGWAERQSLIAKLPHFDMPKRTAKMKGRPITLEEFERIVSAVDDLIPSEHAPSWKRLLRGLWWSGLRLGEALALTWHEGPFAISMEGRRPRLHIEPLTDKSGKPRLLPLAPEFWEFLYEIPKDDRSGHVFRVSMPYNADLRRLDSVSKMIVSFGKHAGVKVWSKGERTKCASAHDFRRAFGQRWAQRLLPQQLQELMRHESVHTTMTYYAGRNAEAVERAAEAAMPGSTNDLTNALETVARQPPTAST